MILPEELRVGNVVQFIQGFKPGAEKRITALDLLTIDTKGGHNVNPIPVTPKNLWAMGFVSTQFPNSFNKSLPNGRCVVVKFFENNVSISIFYLLQNLYPEKLYIHQLQNLVFFVAGVEIF